MPFGPRTTKDLVEEALFARRRDLFGRLLDFFDTTSLAFHGAGGQTLGQHGYSRGHRPDLRQMVVGVVLDGDGQPVCSELWPGTVTDVRTLVPVVDRLRRSFPVGEICVVAERGLLSASTIAAVEARGWGYILGVRLRSSTEAREVVRTHEGHFRTVYPRRHGATDTAPLRVKQVWREDRRYLVCVNPDEAEQDREDRAAILAALTQALARGDKALVRNQGFRRFLKTQGQRFAIDEAKVAADAAYDGTWVLRTKADLPMDVVALAYNELWQVEALFRSMKAVLKTRPIDHQRDETIRGHVFCSFLARLLRHMNSTGAWRGAAGRWHGLT
jgi:transposase